MDKDTKSSSELFSPTESQTIGRMANATTKLTESDLRMLTGTEGYTRHNPILFHDFLLTDGCKYVAEQAGAYWLFDAIASHQRDPKLKKGKLRDMQFWTLKKITGTNAALLTCVADSGYKPAISQEIPFTDFPLESITIYVQNNGEGYMVAMLPSEY